MEVGGGGWRWMELGEGRVHGSVIPKRKLIFGIRFY